MSDESLLQPSPLRDVPSLTAGDTVMCTNDAMTQRETELLAQLATAQARVDELSTALEACIEGFLRSQVYALLAKLKKEAQP